MFRNEEKSEYIGLATRDDDGGIVFALHLRLPATRRILG